MVCPQGASAEEVKRMEKEVREQEQLLTGYQQENERLYKELKQMQAKEKANEARMFSENQRLGKEDFFALLQYCELPHSSPPPLLAYKPSPHPSYWSSTCKPRNTSSYTPGYKHSPLAFLILNLF